MKYAYVEFSALPAVTEHVEYFQVIGLFTHYALFLVKIVPSILSLELQIMTHQSTGISCELFSAWKFDYQTLGNKGYLHLVNWASSPLLNEHTWQISGWAVSWARKWWSGYFWAVSARRFQHRCVNVFCREDWGQVVLALLLSFTLCKTVLSQTDPSFKQVGLKFDILYMLTYLCASWLVWVLPKQQWD